MSLSAQTKHPDGRGSDQLSIKAGDLVDPYQAIHISQSYKVRFTLTTTPFSPGWMVRAEGHGEVACAEGESGSPDSSIFVPTVSPRQLVNVDQNVNAYLPCRPGLT